MLANPASLISRTERFTVPTTVVSSAMMPTAASIVQNCSSPGRRVGRGCVEQGNGEGLPVTTAGDPISSPAWSAAQEEAEPEDVMGKASSPHHPPKMVLYRWDGGELLV